MKPNPKFLVCQHCGNVAVAVVDKGGPISCCGENMKKLEPNTVDASKEKHLPVVTDTDGGITVTVGSAEHPMEAEHHIGFIFVETEHGGQRKVLKAGDKPSAAFSFAKDKPIAVYAYCNLHGLWKTDI